MMQRSKEKLRERRRTGEGGFTLVELIVVIAILAILAGIVVFAVGGLGDKGQKTSDKTTCSILQTAEEAYFANQTPGAYTNDQGVLKSKGFLHTTNTNFVITLVAGPPQSYTIAYTDADGKPADCG
jgi:general secretion pathway protein G